MKAWTKPITRCRVPSSFSNGQTSALMTGLRWAQPPVRSPVFLFIESGYVANMQKNHEEWQPPDQIIRDVDDTPGPWQVTLDGGIQETEWAQDLSEQADQDDWPMPYRVIGRNPVTDPVHADNHSNALPDLGISRGCDPRPFEELVRENYRPCSPNQIVDPGGPQYWPDPPRAGNRLIMPVHTGFLKVPKVWTLFANDVSV